MINPEYHPVSNSSELFTSAVKLLIEFSYCAVHDQGRARVAVPLHSAMHSMYGLLLSPPYCDQLQWQKVGWYVYEPWPLPSDLRQEAIREVQEHFLNLLPASTVQMTVVGHEDLAQAPYSGTTAEPLDVTVVILGASHRLDPAPDVASQDISSYSGSEIRLHFPLAKAILALELSARNHDFLSSSTLNDMPFDQQVAERLVVIGLQPEGAPKSLRDWGAGI